MKSICKGMLFPQDTYLSPSSLFFPTHSTGGKEVVVNNWLICADDQNLKIQAHDTHATHNFPTSADLKLCNATE